MKLNMGGKGGEREIQGQEQSSKACRMAIICKYATYWFCLTRRLNALALSIKNTSQGPKSLSQIVSTNTTIYLKIKLDDKIR